MDDVVRRKSIQVIRDSYRVYRTMSGEREFCRNCKIIGPVGDPVMAMSVVEGEGGSGRAYASRRETGVWSRTI
jgi:hypothetical protein